MSFFFFLLVSQTKSGALFPPSRGASRPASCLALCEDRAAPGGATRRPSERGLRSAPPGQVARPGGPARWPAHPAGPPLLATRLGPPSWPPLPAAPSAPSAHPPTRVGRRRFVLRSGFTRRERKKETKGGEKEEGGAMRSAKAGTEGARKGKRRKEKKKKGKEELEEVCAARLCRELCPVLLPPPIDALFASEKSAA